MFTRHLEIVLLLAAAFGTAGCKCAPKTEAVAMSSYRPPGKLSFELPGFNTLAELKTWYNANTRTKELFFFEKGESQAVIVVADWGHGDSWDALYFYAPNGYSKQWSPCAVWDAETRGVRVTFDKQTGMVHVTSGKGVIILSANIAALAPPASRDW